jgi:hypothetical protein
VAKKVDDYGEFFDDSIEPDLTVEKFRDATRKAKAEKSKLDERYEIGAVPEPTPEALERIERYKTDWEAMHMEVFTKSTGIKPFGLVQKKSLSLTKHIIETGGKGVILEPRGFGKTTRTSNNALIATLQGRLQYALIISSSLTKAFEIMESMLAELQDNIELAKLYPVLCACFEHVSNNSFRKQTYLGEPTYIKANRDKIQFPIIPGQPWSGAIIKACPIDNVRGINLKIKYGPMSGQVLRPQLVFLDDPQTDEQAISPITVDKMVKTIKKSILFGGSHAKPVSALMCATPIAPGDVPSHFVLNEPAWEFVETKMVTKMPTNINLWLSDYAKILLDFDRSKPGDRTRARLAARKFVEENYQVLHEGHEVSWDWAYAWSEEPQTEISALQHAMNFLIENGVEAFESECQCNVTPVINDSEGIKSTVDEIVNKTHDLPRRYTALETTYICTHIDVNSAILTYATCASPKDFRPMMIDNGEWPDQHGVMWAKGDILNTLHRMYPQTTEVEEYIYLAVKDLINELGQRIYIREDNLEMQNNLILVDMGWKVDPIQQAVRDSNFRNITCCYRGQGLGAKDKPFMDRHYTKGSQKHFHCATVPSRDRTLKVLYSDVNYFKTEFHRGVRIRAGLPGSFSVYRPERIGQHLLLGRHCVAEEPREDVDEKLKTRVITWTKPSKSADNEFFDNIVGTFGGLFKLGCEKRAKAKKRGTFSMQEYMDQQGDLEL